VIIVLERGAKPEQIAEAVHALEKRGLEVRQLVAAGKPILHVTGGDSSRARRLLRLEQVEGLIPTSGPRVRLEGRRFFPYHVIQWSAFGIVVLGALVLLAGQFPPGIGLPVDVQSPPEVVAQPWYARGPLWLLELFPTEHAWLAWCVFGLVALAFVFVPRLDRGSSSREASPKLRLAVALLVLAALAFAVTRGGAA
jgi:hypothetical protein